MHVMAQHIGGMQVENHTRVDAPAVVPMTEQRLGQPNMLKGFEISPVAAELKNVRRTAVSENVSLRFHPHDVQCCPERE